jgi:DNA processing protein
MIVFTYYQFMNEFTIPEKLKNIPQPPEKLYINGQFPCTEKYLCIVGSRKNTEYGRRICEELLKGLRGYSITIVSGLAYGIDAIAHQNALINQLPTIAFPGSSVDFESIYPSSHLSLAKKIIVNNGCLISEYEAFQRGQPWMFPERNRLMAGISDAVLIIEAEIKSGTLITGRLALDYNRDVLAVPGSVFSKYSDGPNYLIKIGATPILNSGDILDALHLKKKINQDNKESFLKELEETSSPTELIIISNLFKPISREELLQKLLLPINEINIALSLLELKGIIEERLGLLYLKF